MYADSRSRARRRACPSSLQAGAIAAVTAAFGGACLSTTVINIGTKTSLERQLMGELEPLTQEELLAASVRAEARALAGSLADSQAAAVAARRRQLFNRDDVDEAKELGCLGESRDAELVVRPCDAARDPKVTDRLAKLAAEETQDRRAIIAWALAADSTLTDADRPAVARVYRRLLAAAARPGEWVQGDDGSWARR